MEGYLKQVRETFKDNKSKYDYLSQLLSQFINDRIDTIDFIQDMKIALQHHRDLRLGFNVFLPKDFHKVAFAFDAAIDFAHKVQRRFHKDEQTQIDFFQTVIMYRDGKNSVHEVCQKIAKLFEGHIDLLKEFACIIEDGEIRETLFNYQQRRQSIDAEGDLDEGSAKNHERIEMGLRQRTEEENNGDLNGRQREECIQGYKVFSKKRYQNKHEIILFDCEEDRFELDMLLSSTTAAIQSMDKQLTKLQNGIVKQDGEFPIEKHLTDMNLRCIERIYGDYGLDMIDLLRERAGKGLAVILNRLKQKHIEWSRCLEGFNKIWAAVYAKNYNKSLRQHSIER
ncbi:hypothetical protein SUGI_0502070 [Cryptomeria japonica]|uniref:paired amphipathic helix protein Sin3-like 3 n=1 Tax=Cryptomeria japonica TaxID=3369 RepID=UPI002408BC7F|nr:paired amphipathic helix protein Sin3-like 3 [Cryptomeria japonica]GLJ26175.1 hypothetical protein SUGI_0502070 [Cryptomeria japonica]